MHLMELEPKSFLAHMQQLVPIELVLVTEQWNNLSWEQQPLVVVLVSLMIIRLVYIACVDQCYGSAIVIST